MNEKRAVNLMSKPNFVTFNIINKDLLAINSTRNHIHWDKPTFVGAAVLELAKLHLYKFHYDVIKAKYGDRAQLLFTDTDSLCCNIYTDDLYRGMVIDDMGEFDMYMDTSNFPKDNPCYSLANDRKLGYFKDECAGEQPREFVGLRPKMYSLLLASSEKYTAKGIKKTFAKKHLTHKHYVDVLNNQVGTKAEYFQIRSKNHVLSTEPITKQALSIFCDKRYILDDGVSSLSYGHYKIDSSV